MRLSAFLLLTLLAAPASAQEQTFGESHFVGEQPVDLLVHWGRRAGEAHGVVQVRVGDASATVHDGAPAYAWSAANDTGVLVAVVGASATVEVRFVPIVAGAPGPIVRASVSRLAGADRSPIGAAIAARPDGFAVFWQEASTSNPSATYETYVARFDPRGRAIGASARVQAPWPIADVAWMPTRGQYYFLLYYGGADPRGTRLCGVHVGGESLHNLEHPWWASRPGLIDEAQLSVRGERVIAVYRDDGNLREALVTGGSWGQDPAPARARGPIGVSEAFGLRVTDQGVQIRRARLSP